MPRGNPVELSTRVFPTQVSAISFFSQMLARYSPGERPNEEDQLDLAALFERHPEYVLKMGVGLSHYEVMRSDHGSNCFRLVRTDRSGTDIGIIHAVRGAPPPRKSEVSRAFRWAVRIDLFNARDDFFKQHRDADGRVPCAVTKALIGRDEAHMDHLPPMTFEVLVTTFLAHRGLDVGSVPLTEPKDDQFSPEIADDALRAAFCDWHHRMAKLDIVAKGVNLRQATPNRIRAGRVTLREPKPVR